MRDPAPTNARRTVVAKRKNPGAALKAEAAPGLALIDPQRVRVQLEAKKLLDPSGPPAPTAEPAQINTESAAAEALRVVRESPLFGEVDERRVADAIRFGEVVLLTVGRDMLFEQRERAYLVLEGQLALGEFAPEILTQERRAQQAYRPEDPQSAKREYVRRQDVGPTIRLAADNLGILSPGDLLRFEGLEPVPAMELALYSVTPARVLAVSQSRLDEWGRAFPALADRLRRATAAVRDRFAANRQGGGAVADFFVRQGISVSSMLRVRNVDSCIECYACEAACEERFGAQRLWINGKVLGGLDIVNACRTCVDQRCIDPCEFDAIHYDVQKKEVIIKEDACTGCTMCARACPYDAIRMYELAETPQLKARLASEGNLGHGNGTPRKAPLTRIASKCTHCDGYEDQACISACPTGALLDILPKDAFVERTGEVADNVLGGFKESVKLKASEIFRPSIFIRGVSPDEALGMRPPSLRWLWIVSTVVFVGALTEILLRFSAQLSKFSLLYLYMIRVEHLEPEIALRNVNFYPGSVLAIWLGRTGAVAMLVAMLYAWPKWRRAQRPIQGWFDLHIWSGTMGLLFVVLHSAFKLNPPMDRVTPAAVVTFVPLVAFWLLLATTISGVVGRFLFTKIPALAARATLLERELRNQLAQLRNRHAGVLDADLIYEQLGERYVRAAEPGPSPIRTALRALRVLLSDDLRRPFRAIWLSKRLPGIKDHAARREVGRLTAQLAILKRQQTLLPAMDPLFRWWRTVHIPAAIVLVVLALVHVVIEELGPYFMGKS
jgi:Fe-S-cluster-containing hydrogenase component 2